MTPRFPLRPGGSRLPPGFQLTPDGGVLRHLTPTTPLAPVPMIPAFSGRVLYVPEQQATLPASPPIPGTVVSGDIITATHENTVTTSLGDLWVNEQWIAAHMLEDPTSTLGDLIVRDAGALNRLSIGAPATVLTVDVNQPLKLKWAPPTGGVTSVFTRTGDVIAKAGDYTVAQVTGAMADPTTSQGDLIARGVSAVGRVPLGSDGAALFADRGQALGVRWGAITPTGIGAAPATTKIIAGAGLGGGGPISADVTLTANVVAVNGQTGNVVIDAVPSTTQIIAGTGLSGGGKLTRDVTINAAVWSVFGRFGNVIAATGDYTVAQVTGAVPDSRRVLGGTGLTGGGDLTVDRTLSVVNDTTNQQVQVALGGALTSTRRQLNFIAGTDQLINVVDDPTNNRVDVTFTVTGGGGVPGPSLYSVDGAVIATRTELNLISGAGINLTGVDNTGANRVDVTISTPAAVFSVFGRSGMVVAKTGDYLVDQVTGAVPTTRVINAGAGLIGGGDLSADRSFTVVGDTTTQRVQVASAGVVMGTRQEINFIQGANATLAVVDNPGGNRVDVTITGNPAGQNQTPWLSNIDAAQFTLTDITEIDFLLPGANPKSGSISATTGGFNIAAGSSTALYLYAPQGIQLQTGSGRTVNIPLSLTGAFSVNAGSGLGLVVVGNGNVGIMLTTTPAYPLDVAGDVNITGVYRVNGVPISTFTSPLTTKGDVMVFGTATTRLAVGATGQVLTVDPAQTLGLKWATPAAGGGAVAGADQQIQYNKAGVMGADASLTWIYSNATLTVQSSTTIPEISILGTGASAQINLQSNGGGQTTFNANSWSGASHNGGFNLLITSQRGTLSTPTATQAADTFLNCLFSGHNGTGGVSAGAISVQAEANWTTSANPVYIAFSTAAAGTYVERVRISSAGFVGILTTSPQAALDVNGCGVFRGLDAQTSGQWIRVGYVQGTSGYGDILCYDQTAGAFRPLNIRGNPIYFTNGNVGVGTTTPAAPLEVLASGGKSVQIGGSATTGSEIKWTFGGVAHYSIYNSGNGNLIFANTSATAIGGVGTTIVSLTGGGVLQFPAALGDKITLYAGSYGIGIQSNTLQIYSQNTATRVGIGYGTSAAFTETMSVINTNVGIGTISPGVRLDIVSNDNSGSGGAIRTYSQNLTQNMTLSWGGISSTAYFAIQTSTAGGYCLQLQPSGGLVGIGTTAPAQILTVINAGLTPTTVAQSNQIAIGESSNNTAYRLSLGFGYLSGLWSGVIQCTQGGGMGPLHLNPSGGMVGIGMGTTPPPTLLTLNGGPPQVRIAYGNYSGLLYNDGGAFYILLTNNGDPWGTFNGLRPFVINFADGTVGIGGAPSAGNALTVNGNAYVSSRFGIGTSAPSQLFHCHTGANSNIIMWNNGSTGILECNNDAGSADSVLTIAANPLKLIGGNVAIGNLVPSYLLTLAADQALKPATTTWSVGSDMRTKRNVRELEGGLDVIRRLPRPIVAEYNGLGQTPTGTRVVSFDLEKLRAVLPHTVASARGKLREDDAEETDLLAFNIHEVLMHLILAVQQLAEKN